MTLTREDVLNMDDITTEPLDVPEWGARVHIRGWSAAGREGFERCFFRDDKRRLREWMAVTVLCDEAGAPLFTEADLDALGKRSAKALDRIYEAGLRINGLTTVDVKELEDAAASAGATAAGGT